MNSWYIALCMEHSYGKPMENALMDRLLIVGFTYFRHFHVRCCLRNSKTGYYLVPRPPSGRIGVAKSLFLTGNLRS